LSIAVGCGDDPLAPFQPEITNVADNFQLQATGVTNVTATRTYTWQNSGTRATINHSTTLAAGTIHLTMRDGAGTVVYDKDLVPSLTEPSAQGTAGNWTIVVRMTDYSGSVNFRAQKL
jgi:hypothetical protein